MEVLRIVLLGMRGAGKSSAGNTLLGSKPFYTAPSSQGVTQTSSMSTSTVDGHKIYVVDTPGWTNPNLMEDETELEIAKCIDLSDPGPHVFLLAIPIGCFTNEEIGTARQILEVFGKEVSKFIMVLFTKADDLEEKSNEEYLDGVHPDLEKILEDCGGRYHVFNNRDQRNHNQVSRLLEKIKLMVEENEGKHYTKAMYEDAAVLMGEKRITKSGDSEVRKDEADLQEDRQRENTVMEFDQDTNEEDKYPVHIAKFPSEKSPSEKFCLEESCGKKSPLRKEGHSKQLHTMELKWQKREAELQKSIERKEMTWLKEKSGLEKEIQQLGIKLGQKKAELENVKKELQQQQVRADAFKNLRLEGQRQKQEIESLTRENEANREKMRQRSLAFQKHCTELETMIDMNKEADLKTLQKCLSQLKKNICHPR